MTPYPNPTKNQQNPMARFETGPMKRKTNGFRPFENKTNQKQKI